MFGYKEKTQPECHDIQMAESCPRSWMWSIHNRKDACWLMQLKQKLSYTDCSVFIKSLYLLVANSTALRKAFLEER
jgi:hypothetical protein